MFGGWCWWQIRFAENDPISVKLAEVFDAPIRLNSGTIVGSMRWQAAKKSKSILVFEGGESQRFDSFAIDTGMYVCIYTYVHTQRFVILSVIF
jgi:hypothetical protein